MHGNFKINKLIQLPNPIIFHYIKWKIASNRLEISLNEFL